MPASRGSARKRCSSWARPSRAKELAAELEDLNRDRQQIEDRILREGVALVEALPEKERRRRGYVLASEDWHVGVIGIVASRLVERFNRPVVLIAGGTDSWKGSGRSIPTFDLHGALAACSAHLERFGAREIDREEYLSRLPDLVRQEGRVGKWTFDADFVCDGR